MSNNNSKARAEPGEVNSDLFDPSNLVKMKLSQDFATMAAVGIPPRTSYDVLAKLEAA